MTEHAKESRLKEAFFKYDKKMDGSLGVVEMRKALVQVITSVDQQSIEKFIKFMDKDSRGRISYTDFLNKMTDASNKNHNPFQHVARRLKHFLTQNGLTVDSLMRRLAVSAKKESTGINTNAVSVNYFGRFLKNKIDKKRAEGELMRHAQMMDIDQDGFIDKHDLGTVLGNLQNETFFANNGETVAMSTVSRLTTPGASQSEGWFPKTKMELSKAAQVVKLIKEACVQKSISFNSLFKRLDSSGNGLLSFPEFSTGIDEVAKLSPMVKEQLFALMDTNTIGMVDYDSFLEVLQITMVSKPKEKVMDNFDWEEEAIEALRAYIRSVSITPEEAFKAFDHDFDGIVSKADLKWVLIHILKYEPSEIQPTKLERLYRLMDFYKTGKVQLSDIVRLIDNENPYKSYSANFTTAKFTNQQNTFNWRQNAVQQLGLALSKKYESVQDSFERVSNRGVKIEFDTFKQFLDKSQMLNGFNLTKQLQQQLFSELDAHKKGFLTENDWILAFSQFNWNTQILIELANALEVAFSDCDSAFEHFIQCKEPDDKKRSVISRRDFVKGFRFLTNNRFQATELERAWANISNGNPTMTKEAFKAQFETMNFSGSSTLRRAKTAGHKTKMFSASSSQPKWENDIFEKIRSLIRASPTTLKEIFGQMDTDHSGKLSNQEFRNGIRKLSLGLTSREIDQLMVRIDTNQDGMIDYREFCLRFSGNKVADTEKIIRARASNKLASLKELMHRHMVSYTDAFDRFDSSRSGQLTYTDFQILMNKLHEVAGNPKPTYQVMKDLFELIDVRKDGHIDKHEWNQTFAHIQTGDRANTLKELPKDLAAFENSRTYNNVSAAVAKNRKLLAERFSSICDEKGLVDFGRACETVRMVTRGV